MKSRLGFTPDFKWFLAGLILVAALGFGATRAFAAPTVTLTASPNTGLAPLSVTLSWTSAGAVSCTASGAWTGTKALNGTVVVSVSATSTFNLLCAAADGTAQVSWTPPTQNTDGTPLTDLAGFKLYHAPLATDVATSTPIVIADKLATSYTIAGLPAGTRFYAMKATNAAGVDSDMTGNVSSTIVLGSTTASASVTITTKPKPPTLVTIAQIAYDLKTTPAGYKLGQQVGYVAIGAPCIAPVPLNKPGYASVDRSIVDFFATSQSQVVVAQCAQSI